MGAGRVAALVSQDGVAWERKAFAGDAQHSADTGLRARASCFCAIACTFRVRVVGMTLKRLLVRLAIAAGIVAIADLSPSGSCTA